MCGRYTLSTPGDLVARHFGLAERVELQPSYNAAPTQQLPVVRRAAQGARRLDLLRWGLVPDWADDPSIGSRLINARSESAGEKPAFRASFRYRRCLVPADGFYEWRKEGGRKQPYLVRRRGGGVLAFAGLWSRWQGDGGDPPLETFTILTTRPNSLVKRLHDRMPVILPPEAYPLWLSSEVKSREELRPLLEPCPADLLEAFPVSRLVNDVQNDSPACVRPLEPGGGS